MVRSDYLPAEPLIAVDHAGAGQGVLFLHGIGGRKGNWSRELEVLAPHYHAIAWDARGYGDSADYRGPFSFEDVAADIDRVRLHFGHDTLHLVGLSMGGVIALDYLARRPAHVASLTLCATTLALSSLPPETIERFLAERRGPLLAGRSPSEIAPALARSLLSARASQHALDAARASIAGLRVDSYLKTLDAVTRHRPALDLSTIAVPTLVIAGTEDSLIPVDHARDLAAAIPGAQLAVIDGAGHLVNFDKPVQFSAHVLGFLLTSGDRVEDAR